MNAKEVMQKNVLLALKDEEVLQEFEMVELKGGNSPGGDIEGKGVDVLCPNIVCPGETNIGEDCKPPIIPPINNIKICGI